MRDLVKLVRADLDAALVGIAKKHGLASLKCGSGTLGASNFTLKVEGVVADGKSPEAERYDLYADSLRLPPRGHVFTAGKYTYKTIGLNTTGSKVLADRIPDGKTFLVPVGAVQKK